MTRLYHWFVVLVCAWLLGCGATPPIVATPKPLPAPALGLLAGVASADITPPLHLSLFGHGPEGRIASGFRLRLRCQVFLFVSGGQPLALIPCDLQSPSMTLQRAIARRLRDAGVPLKADRIYLMATHTHAGPAHYFDAQRYSGAFSSVAPGYDQKVVDFLAGHIAEATVRAFNKLTPACVGSARSEAWRLTFNRSYAPFLANRDTRNSAARHTVTTADAADKRMQRPMPDPAAQPSGPPKDLSGPETAVDPGLFVLRVDARSPGETSCSPHNHPLGVLAVFGMHPTAIPNSNELYHGDVFGFATRFAESCLRAARDSRQPEAAAKGKTGSELLLPETCDGVGNYSTETGIVGLANGIEGDVSPNVNDPSVAAARRLGRDLGRKIAETAAAITDMSATWLDPKTQKPGPLLSSLYWELTWPNAQYANDDRYQLCEFPELGMASAGGARDGATRLRSIPEANAGFRLRVPQGCHRYKIALRLGLGHGDYEFPTVAPIGLLRVGDLYFATVPAEVSTIAGIRIRETLASKLGLPPSNGKPGTEKLAVVGLTNQWLQYVTTWEEYDYQYYEGASNLYGPGAALFLQRQFGCLADAQLGTAQKDLKCQGQPKINTLGALDVEPGPLASRMPDDEDDLKPVLLQNPTVQVTRSEGDVGWSLTFPRLPLTFSADRTKFSVQVLAGSSGDDHVIDDDRGAAIEVREVNGGELWRVRWAPDLAGPEHPWCDDTFRIAIRGRHRFESSPFKLECAYLPGGARQ